MSGAPARKRRNIDPDVARERGRVGSLAAAGASPARLEEARVDLAAARLAEHIRRVVDAAPPLTPEQRERLALLLRPAGASDAPA